MTQEQILKELNEIAQKDQKFAGLLAELFQSVTMQQLALREHALKFKQPIPEGTKILLQVAGATETPYSDFSHYLETKVHAAIEVLTEVLGEKNFQLAYQKVDGYHMDTIKKQIRERKKSLTDYARTKKIDPLILEGLFHGWAIAEE